MSHDPLLSTVSCTAVVVDEVYLFKEGTAEFTSPPGKAAKKQFRTQINKFLSCNARVVLEFPLQMFSSWFQDLPLSKQIKHNLKRKGCNKIWQYKVVILYPGNAKKTKVEVRMSDWATETVIQFYGKSFNCTDADLNCVKHAVTSDPSIMIVGRPFGEGVEQSKAIVECADSGPFLSKNSSPKICIFIFILLT